MKHIAISGFTAQIAVAMLLGMLFSSFMGWTLLNGLVFGLCFVYRQYRSAAARPGGTAVD